MKHPPIALLVAVAVLAAAPAHAQNSTAPPQNAAPVVHRTPQAKPAATAPKPYVNSFPVSNSPAAHGIAPTHPLTTPHATVPAATHPAKPQAKPATATPTHPAATTAKPAAAATTKPAAAPTAAKPASTPTAPPAVPQYSSFNRTTIVLDPAHGGQDNGSRLTDSLVEKDIALAFAFKLRSLLQARGFTVILTRDSNAATEASDPSTPLTLDDRAGTANHARAVACLLLHATGAGTGVHLYHSELDPTPGEQPSAPWLTAQAAWVSQSTELSQKIAQSITRSSIPLVASAASVRPVDSLTCPALVVEIAPRDSGDAATASDSDYQQKIAEAIASALVFWRNQAQPPKLLTATAPGGKP